MKSLITILAVIFISISGFSQSGINYKAIIKDGGGNILVSQAVDLQFIIYEGAALTNNVYQESHTTNTDANGIVIVNIGEGTTTDVFTDVAWGNDEHWLNVQVDTGTGLMDLGTTQFMAVPYALNAANVSGLEALNEGNGIGYRLVNTNPIYYGNIGSRAVDLSYGGDSGYDAGQGAVGLGSVAMGQYTTANAGSVAMGYGTSATGQYSTSLGSNTTASGPFTVAMGESSTASGLYATAIGFNTEASGQTSTSLGFETEATGQNSTALGKSTNAVGENSFATGELTIATGKTATAMGNGTNANGLLSTAIGRFNIGGGDPVNWVETDPLFEIGNGSGFASKANALTVLKNGSITAPSFDMAEITDNKALITKEFADANYLGGGPGTNPTGLETLNEGNGIGWRLIGRDANNYGNIGLNSIDISFSDISSTTNGATGNYSFAFGRRAIASGESSTSLGIITDASGDFSTAMGRETIASGDFSTAIGFETSASESYSIAMGNGTIASGNTSTALGSYTIASGINATSFGETTIASGRSATAMGRGTIADDIFSTVVGKFNDNTTSTTTLFQVGNGGSTSSRMNAFNIETDGTITAPSFEISEITDNKALITKEYFDANGASGLEALDEGNGIGWRLKASNPDYYGAIGLKGVDLSTSLNFSTIYGATGVYSTAMGYSTEASSIYSTAMGYNSIASAQAATAMGTLTQALGTSSTALGNQTIASGNVSFATGELTLASAYLSTALGRSTIADDVYSTVIGKYNNNTSSTSTLFQVGNGTSNTNRSNAFTVLNNGKVGIGTQNPETLLHVQGLNSIGLGNGTGMFLVGYEGGTNLVFDSNGLQARLNGATANLHLQYLGGLVAVGGTVVHSSDRRLKKDIEDLNYGLKEILALNPKSYNWKNRIQEHKSLGLIAQEVKPILKELVHVASDEDKTLSVSYTELIPILIKAIQEQHDIIKNQDLKIIDLTAELDQRDLESKEFDQRLELIETLLKTPK